MARLYDTWTDDEGKERRTCAIITAEANELVARIHNRMLVILHPGECPIPLLTVPCPPWLVAEQV